MKTIGIVASEFNRKFVDGLVGSALKVLKDHPVKVVHVPGAYEIPLMVQRLIQRDDIGVVIAFGVVWQGKTAHADIIACDASRVLMDMMLKYNKPVIQQILTVSNEKQAQARCFGKKLNRGIEGAQAALKMLSMDL
ncbi:MAG: 6,7-dimethyl-8-ribityllumazine synthase [Verrucomicrobiota bacterium]